MEISHLVVNGCSWTYCQGLENPRTNGWPAIVAKELGVPLVNLAVSGSGNDGIHRRTYEYAFEDFSNNNPFYIIAWTQTWRREAWCRKIYHKQIDSDGYYSVGFPNDKPSNILEEVVLETWSEEDFFRKLILHRLSLDSLFKSKNIEYFSSFFAEQEFNNGKYEHVKNIDDIKIRFNRSIKHLFFQSNVIERFDFITSNHPKTKCGHEDISGNKAIADYVLYEMYEKYKTITYVEKDFLTLDKYLLKTDPGIKHNEWT